MKSLKRPENVVKMLAGTTFSVANTIEIPRQYCRSVQLLEGKGGTPDAVMARNTSVGRAVPSRRTRLRVTTVNQLRELAVMQSNCTDDDPPSEEIEVLGLERFDDGCRSGARFDVSVLNTLGRVKKFAPKRNALRTYKPITPDEARRAVRSTGLISRGEKSTLYVMTEEEVGGDSNVRAVRFNMNATAGLPWMCGTNEPGVVSEGIQMARALITYIRHGDGNAESSETRVMRNWRRFNKEFPYVCAFLGKGKGDFYTVKKVEELMARFYVATPFTLKAAVGPVVQAGTEHKLTMFDHDDVTTFQGCSFARGGGKRFVDEVDRRLCLAPVVIINAGDDTCCVYRVRGRFGEAGTDHTIETVAIDGSSFDLTQMHQVTMEVKRKIRDHLVEQVSGGEDLANLWLAMMSFRQVVIGQVVFTTEDTGPSGLMLQSELNNAIMAVACERLKNVLMRYEADRSTFSVGEDDSLPCLDLPEGFNIGEEIARIGADLGFSFKKEQHMRSTRYFDGMRDATFRAFLETKSFLFCGYSLSGRYEYDREQIVGTRIRVCADYARACPRMMYPGGKYIKDRTEFERRDVESLASSLLALGEPEEEYLFAYQQACHEVCKRVDELIRNYGEDADLTDRMEAVFGIGNLKTLGAVRRALNSPLSLWHSTADLGVPLEDGPCEDDTPGESLHASRVRGVRERVSAETWSTPNLDALRNAINSVDVDEGVAIWEGELRQIMEDGGLDWADEMDTEEAEKLQAQGVPYITPATPVLPSITLPFSQIHARAGGKTAAGRPPPHTAPRAPATAPSAPVFKLRLSSAKNKKLKFGKGHRQGRGGKREDFGGDDEY